jgi:hypothetical protein
MTAIAIAALIFNFALTVWLILSKRGINISVNVKHDPIPGPTFSRVDDIYDEKGNPVDKEMKDMLGDVAQQIQSIMLDTPMKGGNR